MDNEKKAAAMPGPSEYDLKQSMASTGEYFHSKLKNSQARSFGKSIRNSQSMNKLNVPGPGSYTSPSDFGIYDLPKNLKNKQFL